MRYIILLISLLSGLFIVTFNTFAAEPNYAGGTYFWEYGHIQQVVSTKEGKGGYSLEIWPYKRYQPNKELGPAPFKYYGGPEVFELAHWVCIGYIKGLSFAPSKTVAHWGNPSYLSRGKKIAMYRVINFFYRSTEPPEGGAVIQGGMQVPENFQGWCCANGKVFPSTPQECEQQRRGFFSPAENEVHEHCRQIQMNQGRVIPHQPEPNKATPITLPGPRSVE